MAGLSQRLDKAEVAGSSPASSITVFEGAGDWDQLRAGHAALPGLAPLDLMRMR
jgi:hypothetical protein